MEINQIYCMDAYFGIRKWQEAKLPLIDCVVTSPPYYRLRDYKVEGQIGLELTPEEYIDRLRNVFDECYLIMKSTGSVWVNISDTYIKGELALVPFQFALMMKSVGWKLRQSIIWKKNNCMPSSVKNRFTPDFEYVFFFVKSNKYYFKQIKEPCVNHEDRPFGVDRNRLYNYDSKETKAINTGIKFGGKKYGGKKDYPIKSGKEYVYTGERNKRTVWEINTKPIKDEHYAAFPELLVDTILEAGCPLGGLVLDPFIGRGTTGIVAKKRGLNYLGFDLSPDSCDLARKNIYGLG